MCGHMAAIRQNFSTDYSIRFLYYVNVRLSPQYILCVSRAHSSKLIDSENLCEGTAGNMQILLLGLGLLDDDVDHENWLELFIGIESYMNRDKAAAAIMCMTYCCVFFWLRCHY